MHKTVKKTFALTTATVGIGGAFLLGAALIMLATIPAPAAPLSLINVPSGALIAKAAVIYDPTTGQVLYQKDANEPLPLASLTKLMTATVALKDNKPSLPVAITENNIAPNNNCCIVPGETLTLDQLLKLSLIVSSNDAITAVASSAGSNYIDQMNAEAAAMGLTQMHFLDPTGLDIDTQTAGSYGSAYDVARLAAFFYKTYPQYFELTTTASTTIATPDGNQADATAAPIFNIPGLVAAKTGYTDLAGGNLVVVFDLTIGHPLVAAVLGSTEDGRFTDIETLVSDARAQLAP
jgi:serine-type D-Ala-D-Ala carboxypeptidase (penicillin-binding protein 5/6)